MQLLLLGEEDQESNGYTLRLVRLLAGLRVSPRSQTKRDR